MPFHSSNSHSMKYSSIVHPKIHENNYKIFLKTLPTNNYSSEQKLSKHQQIYFNPNYLIQRQINLQSRQNKRKHEYERIQNENLKFSQKLINAKSFLNRSEQEIFFNKHCKLKQRLQHYPNFIENQINKSQYQFLSNHYPFKIINKSKDSSFSISNNNNNSISHKSNKLHEKYSKTQTIQKKLSQHLMKQNSNILPPITQNTDSSKQNHSKIDPLTNIINWNKSTNSKNLPQKSSPISNNHNSHSSSTFESNLSDLFISHP